ncbi:MAG: ABC transporter ATP-binding protein [Tissierellia bacterium]|nr:ABC transporter ATP-binding protein [Tissierellia bacterium]
MIQIFKKLYAFVGNYRSKLTISLLYTTLEAFAESVKLMAIYFVLKHVFEGTLTTAVLWKVSGLLVGGILFAIIFRGKSTMLQTEVGYNTAAEKRMEIGDHLKYVPLGFMNETSLGRITAVATNTCGLFQDVATMVIMMVGSGIIYAIVITIMLFFFNVWLGLISLGAVIFFFLFNAYLQTSSKTISRRKVEADGRLTEKILEFVQGMVVVKSFHMVGHKTSELKSAIIENRDANIGLELKLVPKLFFQGLGVKLFSAGMLLATIAVYIHGQIELYECITMIFASFMIFLRLESAGAFASLLKLLTFSMDKINQINEVPVMDEKGKNLQPTSLDIGFDNVSFSYETREVLHQISAQIPEGSTVAIVGPSGSGKTTFAHLIPRFWDVDKGSVTLGGVDVRKYTLDSLWNQFTAVFQDVYLFNDTIRNNIAFGKPEATLEEVREVAEKAGCLPFIEKLPDGFDTVVGERGGRLSGGEAQRISIARAMLKDAPIVLLDEATANVDPENEALLQRAIEELTKNKTVIMIAHRLKTVQSADKIFVIDEGKIVASGTHEELMESEGMYRDFVNMREKAMEWKVAK